MAWESRHEAELRRFVGKNPIPKPLSQGGLDDDRRRWTYRCAQHFKFTFPSEGWGTKSAHAALVPQSTDAICTKSPFIGYDLIIAGGADVQRIDYTPDAIDLTGQYFIAVEAKDWGGDGGGGDLEPDVMRLGASLFWGLGGLKHDWPELKQQLREYADAGVDFVRTLIHLNSDDPRNPWRIIGTHAEDPDLESLLARYCDLVSSYGLKVEYTLLGGMDKMDSPNQQDRFVDRFCNAVRSQMHQIEFVEVMNEYGVNGGSIPVLHRMAKRLRSKLGDSFILALSSPNAVHQGGSNAEIQAEVKAMNLHEANAITPHWNRGLNEPPDLGGFAPDLVICGEPRGPSSSVAETDNPADIEHDWKAADVDGYYAYVLHSDSGVWSTYITDQYKDGTRGKWPIFSTHTNGPAILATLKRLRGKTTGGGPSTGVKNATGVAFRTDHGKLITAEPDGKLIANRDYPVTDPGPWEQFEIIRVDSEYCAIRDHHGRYLSCETDGVVSTLDVGDRNPPIQAYEVWHVTPNPIGRNGLIALRSHHGGYLGADEAGHVYTIDHLEGWETFTPYPATWVMR